MGSSELVTREPDPFSRAEQFGALPVGRAATSERREIAPN